MADLTEAQASQAVKIVGAGVSSAIETNFADVDSNGRLKTIDAADGTVASAVPSTAITIGASDGTNLQAAQGRTTNPDPTTFGIVVRTIPYRPKTFTVRAPSVAIGLNKSMLSLLNAGGSAVKVRLLEARLINVQTAAVTGVIGEFQLNRITAHSAGTSLTPAPHDTSDSLNGSVTARTGSTATEAAGPITLRRNYWSTDEWGVGSLDVEGSDHAHQTLGEPFYRSAPESKPIVLNAGEGIHVKQITNSTAGTFDIEFIFTEEAN